MKKKEVKVEKDMEGQKHLMNRRFAQSKTDYINAIINGRYHLARCNMIAEQLVDGGEILESVDGCLKTEEFLRAEYAMSKVSAIRKMREAHFAKRDLARDFNLTDEDIHSIEVDYYKGQIIREDWDPIYDPSAKITKLKDDDKKPKFVK